MKSLLQLVLVILIASVLHDLQVTTTRFLGSNDNSLVRSHGNSADGNSVDVLMTGVSALPNKRSHRSKLIFQIKIDTSKPKKKRGRKRKGKTSLRAKRRKTIINHRNHYHTLRNQYLRKLKGALKHGNHYHKPRLNNGVLRHCCRRPFGRKDVTWEKRRYDQRKPSRRRQTSRRYRPFTRNSRRSKQDRRQSHRSRKTPIRRNNRHRRPAIARRNQWRRTKKIPRKHSSGRMRKGNQKKTRRGRKPGKSKTVYENKEYGNRKDKKSRRRRPNGYVYFQYRQEKLNTVDY